MTTIRALRMVFLSLLLAGLGAAVPVLLAQPPDDKAGRAQKVEAVATTLESPDFLKVPADLNAKDFTVAKAAPGVDVCFFPGLEDHGKGTLWSSWGDGCLAKNGKYYTSVGDHLGTNATSYVYEYNPVSKVLRRVVDVLRVLMQALGLYGHGKIHAAIHEGADGKLYFATYWGKPKQVEEAFTKGFPGSLLLRYDPRSGKTENLGAVVPKQGLPASYYDLRRDLLYFHAVYKGNIAVYDVKAAKVKFLGGADQTAGQRTFLGGADGRVYFSASDGTLHYYDPPTNQLGKTSARLPVTPGAKKDSSLRAAAHPTRSGLLYGMTAAGQLFAFDPRTAAVKDLGANFLGGVYTAVMALSPDEKYLYYAPGAHGGGNSYGVPVVQYELATGRRKVLAFLKEPLLNKYQYNLGGTYNFQIDPAGERLFITFNGAAVTANARRTVTFGKPVLVVLHIPTTER